jgi:transposase-like protein
MNIAVKPVPAGRGRRRRWSADQKLTVRQEWQTGVPLEEIGRKYAVNAAHMYRWKGSLDQGPKEGELIPKSQVLGLQNRVEELELALGRKALGWTWLKTPSRARDSHDPRGCTVSGRLSGASPASDGYRWIHALLKRHGLLCDPTTVWRVMRRRGWLATGRLQRAIGATA